MERGDFRNTLLELLVRERERERERERTSQLGELTVCRVFPWAANVVNLMDFTVH